MDRDRLPRGVFRIGDGFWNIRGSFKVGGVLDIGTHASLVERANGELVLLDACGMSDAILEWLDARTERGKRLKAVLHLHPFHTVHVRALHRRYPDAMAYGTERHRSKAPEIPWQEVKTSDRELAELFAPDLDFSVPEGIELIPAEPNLHFGSVLAFHGPSRTLHVDDTLICVRLPWPLQKLHVVRFHPTLGKVLQRRAGAAAEFRRWGEALVAKAGGLDNLCAAHTAILREQETPLATRIEKALRAVERTLRAHETKYG